MKNFHDNIPKDSALLIVGPPGSGKTTLACRFPKPHVFCLDRNLRGPAAQLASENITDVTYDDEIDVDDKGVRIPLSRQFNKLAEAIGRFETSDRETGILDNTTNICEMICAKILMENPTKTGRMEIPSWGIFFQFWKEWILRLRACSKRIIVISHEKVEKDDIEGSLKYFLAIPGQTGTVLPGFFTDVWRTEVQEVVDATGRHHKRMVRVVQNTRMEYLKTSTPSMPPVWEATQANVNKIIAAF